jgi:hypothetical protein
LSRWSQRSPSNDHDSQSNNGLSEVYLLYNAFDEEFKHTLENSKSNSEEANIQSSSDTLSEVNPQLLIESDDVML